MSQRSSRLPFFQSSKQSPKKKKGVNQCNWVSWLFSVAIATSMGWLVLLHIHGHFRSITDSSKDDEDLNTAAASGNLRSESDESDGSDDLVELASNSELSKLLHQKYNEFFNSTEKNRIDSELSTSHLDIKSLSPPAPASSSTKTSKTTRNTYHGELHIVFSTDCSPYQDWQSLLVFHSANVAGQDGHITRIASGCDQKKQDELTMLYKKLWGDTYDAHFTPDFKKTADGKSYDFYNKPYGLRHFIQNYKHHDFSNDNVVIALIDPDFIFLRPITLKLAGETNNIFYNEKTPTYVPEFITEGVAVAQLYGLGAPWVNSRRDFNKSNICPPGSPCLTTTKAFGEEHYSVGPPYILHIKDLSRLTNVWCDFVPKVYEGYPELLAEMYAYSMAAAHVNLPHITMQSHMVSNIAMSDEGWKWIDALKDDVCEEPVGGKYYIRKPLPTFLHYCQFFRVGEIGFQKRRLHDIFTCEHPLMMELPRDLGKTNYKNRDGEKIPLKLRDSRRGAFMLCTIHRAINAAAEDYKNKMCNNAEKINLEKTHNLAGNTREALRALGF